MRRTIQRQHRQQQPRSATRRWWRLDTIDLQPQYTENPDPQHVYNQASRALIRLGGAASTVGQPDERLTPIDDASDVAAGEAAGICPDRCCSRASVVELLAEHKASGARKRHALVPLPTPCRHGRGHIDVRRQHKWPRLIDKRCESELRGCGERLVEELVRLLPVPGPFA